MSLDKLFGYKWLICAGVALVFSGIMYTAYNLWKQDILDDQVSDINNQTHGNVSKDIQNGKGINDSFDSLPAGGALEFVFPAARSRQTGQNCPPCPDTSYALPKIERLPGPDSVSGVGAEDKLYTLDLLRRDAGRILQQDIGSGQRMNDYLEYVPNTGITDKQPCFGIPDCLTPD